MKTTQVRNLFEPPVNQELRCRHALDGNAPASKQCANWFHCGTCEYDQMLEDAPIIAEPPRMASKAA
jgi:hypothetical protein